LNFVTNVSVLNSNIVGSSSIAKLLNAAQIDGMTVGITELAPGDELPWSIHGCVEIFYVLSGLAEVFISNQQYPISSGDFVVIPTGHRHMVKNVELETLKMLFIKPPEEQNN